MSYHEEQRRGAAVAGKTARACDGCARRRARWYCAADDAFLCQTCDSSVHSANPLARRHRRLRLKSSSCSLGGAALDADDEEGGFDVPTWLRGFKRKARTPRQGKREAAAQRPPELDETSPSIEEEQLLYCVPVFDPSLAELRSASPAGIDEAKRLDGITPASASTVEASDRFAAYLPSDVELAEFAANMESLLGEASVDDSAFSMEKIALLDSAAMRCNNNAGEELKTEQAEEEAEQYCPVDIYMTRESLEMDFNWPGSSSTAEEDEFEEAIPEDQQEETKTAKLRLDYEAVISAWAVHGSSPWTDGERPQINLASCWNDYMGGAWGDARVMGSGGGGGRVGVDEGRQARVSRYREKRRTRLFAKKIRYEVRKLNAEKRPRMKGRFVKRTPGAFLH